MDKLNMKTTDLTDENIDKITTLFPQVITKKEDDNGKVVKAIDFDLLKQELSKEIVEDDSERYRLDWPGKKASILKANTPINKTLRPCKEESVNFDNTENVYIEGDNFEVLKILQESYLGKIKMIYIDPPYNTGKDFVYKDNTTQSKEEYEEELGVEDDEGGKLFKNTDTNGRFHSDWLSMMYERLAVARDLLKDDGVIFMSIDDNEVHNLRKIADEIFGEENFVAQFVWRKKYGGGKGSRFAVDLHEYVICFSKSISHIDGFNLPRTDKQKEIFSAKDEYFKERGGFYVRPLKSGLGERKTLIYPIVCPDGSEINTQWICAENTFKQFLNEGRIVFKKLKDDSYNVYKKFYENDKGGTVLPESLLYDLAYNQHGKEEIKALFNIKEGREVIFENPKPSKLIKYFLPASTSQNDLILDFFSGSASTTHAVMQLNAEDEGNRKFIMVQLLEKTDEKSEAFKAGYKTIPEIGMERIRRAGKKILEENKEKLKERETPLDIGFRVYKTDSSNMKDVYYNPSELEQSNLLDVIDNVKEDRSPEDLLTQVMLDLGLTLDLSIEEKKIKDNKVFFVAENSLVTCFDKNINFEIVDEIAKCEPLKVVFKDSCFKDDKDRINVENRFKRLSPETIVSVI